MLELLTKSSYLNNLGIPSSQIENFYKILIDLNNGIDIRLSKDFKVVSDDTTKQPSNFIPGINYFDGIFSGIMYDFIVVDINAVSSYLEISPFMEFSNFLIQKLPSTYSSILQYGVYDKTLIQLFSKNSLVAFCFKDDILQFVSTFPNERSVEAFIKDVSIRTNLLEIDEKNVLKAVYAVNSINTSYINRYRSYMSISYPLSLFVKRDYFRINSFEFNQNNFSLLLCNNISNQTFNSAESYSKMLSILLDPSIIINFTEGFKQSFGYSLIVNKSYFINVTKKFYVTISPKVITENYSMLEFSEKDKDFIDEVRALNTDYIYSKHKIFLNSNPIRGCKVLSNFSETINVTVREDKKKISDEEAYKARIFRDYLSYAISLIAIPIFQTEFVIPECLTPYFTFKMASLHGAYYKTYGKLRLNESYNNVFKNTGELGWKMLIVPTTLNTHIEQVKKFVKSLKAKTLVSSTQSRPSVFTRHFVEPNIETTGYTWKHLTQPILFGWMFSLDSQLQISWSSVLSTTHTLRSSPRHGSYYCECGLVSDKTFGIKSILTHVFTTSFFNERQIDYSIVNATAYLDVAKKNQCISSVLDIYTANFVPNDKVENAIKSWGQQEYSEYLARVNQLLFLSTDSLNIFNSLYKCETYEDLTTCLEFCMPICLDMLSKLNYSLELKNHVSSALMYFWNTTKAISEELKTYDTITE